jgi:hypothetical protein
MFNIIVYVGATNDIECSQLQDYISKQFPLDALVTFTVFGLDGQPLAGALNVPMTRDTSTAGSGTVYRGVLGATVPLVAGVNYPGVIQVLDALGDARPFNGVFSALAG